MLPEEFEQLVARAVGSLPPRMLDKVKNVALCIEVRPTREQLRETGMRRGDTLLGLYEGAPQTEWGKDTMLYPDKITIFQEAIEESASTPEELQELVRDTVWHEIAHHFGHDEEGVEELEKRHKHD